MKEVTPQVYLISEQLADYEILDEYLQAIGADNYEPEWGNSQHDLVETAGRLCYRSWEPGLNKNVTRVRQDQKKYIENILRSGHGSVLEHVNYTFIFHNVSRVFTHELIRHRAGSAFSQESLRYVRLDDIKFWFPEWVPDDLKPMLTAYLERAEELQWALAEYFGLDKEGTPFAEKKAKTSFMRRFAPEGLGTDIMWTANARTLRHVIELRTSAHAEEELRLVFGEVARIIQEESPFLMQDFTELPDGSWVPENHKV